MVDRELLEQEALEKICACWYYDLVDNIEITSDNELLAIISQDRWPCCE